MESDKSIYSLIQRKMTAFIVSEEQNKSNTGTKFYTYSDINMKRGRYLRVKISQQSYILLGFE